MEQEHSQADPLGPIADEFVQRYRDGERPSLTEYATKYPELADEIREFLPLLIMMEKAGSEILSSRQALSHQPQLPTATIQVPEHVGGFRIQREIGRGGMGVVYEAEQVTLGRRVALKILPSQTVNHEIAPERFRQEARVAARLHHTNIVPVYEIGEDQGIYYYAMQYIHGQSLEQVLAEMSQIRDAAQ